MKAGALDSIDPRRATLFASIGNALAEAERAASQAAQDSLFGDAAPASANILVPTREWTEAERLAHEKASLGYYLSGHPFAAYAAELAPLVRTSLADIQPRQERYLVAGIVTSMRVQSGKRGKVAFVTLDDGKASAEIVVFSEVFDASRAMLREDALVVVEVRAMQRISDDGEPQGLRILAEQVFDLARVRGALGQAAQALLQRQCVGGPPRRHPRAVPGRRPARRRPLRERRRRGRRRPARVLVREAGRRADRAARGVARAGERARPVLGGRPMPWIPARYAALFAHAGAARFAALSLPMRMPLGTVGLATLLHLRELTGSIAFAGSAVGLQFVAMAVTAPLLGRLADRRGPRAVLLTTGHRLSARARRHARRGSARTLARGDPRGLARRGRDAPRRSPCSSARSGACACRIRTNAGPPSRSTPCCSNSPTPSVPC